MFLDQRDAEKGRLTSREQHWLKLVLPEIRQLLSIGVTARLEQERYKAFSLFHVRGVRRAEMHRVLPLLKGSAPKATRTRRIARSRAHRGARANATPARPTRRIRRRQTQFALSVRHQSTPIGGSSERLVCRAHPDEALAVTERRPCPPLRGETNRHSMSGLPEIASFARGRRTVHDDVGHGMRGDEHPCVFPAAS